MKMSNRLRCHRLSDFRIMASVLGRTFAQSKGTAIPMGERSSVGRDWTSGPRYW